MNVTRLGAQPSVVIPREGGGSSIPEPFRNHIKPHGVLGRPAKPGDDRRYRGISDDSVACRGAGACTDDVCYCFVTTLHLVTTASLICPASCAQATSSTFTEISFPTKPFNCAACASLLATI